MARLSGDVEYDAGERLGMYHAHVRLGNSDDEEGGKDGLKKAVPSVVLPAGTQSLISGIKTTAPKIQPDTSLATFGSDQNTTSAANPTPHVPTELPSISPSAVALKPETSNSSATSVVPGRPLKPPASPVIARSPLGKAAGGCSESVTPTVTEVTITSVCDETSAMPQHEESHDSSDSIEADLDETNGISLDFQLEIIAAATDHFSQSARNNEAVILSDKLLGGVAASPASDRRAKSISASIGSTGSTIRSRSSSPSRPAQPPSGRVSPMPSISDELHKFRSTSPLLQETPKAEPQGDFSYHIVGKMIFL
ncbi:unnamed protein product [Protopolystoma xenopodis]|uniref:Uncharacterized protein n=1 Tax=Protopolystoma xenopodis TaxID=117903 RepID=A0A3S4ZEY3_9PLAT|nr:unnamed protein product [Protopolystoma xenopodis]